MRKEIVEHRATEGKSYGNAAWLDLDSIAHVDSSPQKTQSSR